MTLTDLKTMAYSPEIPKPEITGSDIEKRLTDSLHKILTEEGIIGHVCEDIAYMINNPIKPSIGDWSQIIYTYPNNTGYVIDTNINMIVSVYFGGKHYNKTESL